VVSTRLNQKFYTHLQSLRLHEHLGQIEEIRHASRQVGKSKDSKFGYLDKAFVFINHNSCVGSTALSGSVLCDTPVMNEAQIQAIYLTSCQVVFMSYKDVNAF